MDLTGQSDDIVIFHETKFDLNLSYVAVLTVMRLLKDEGLAPAERISLALRLLIFRPKSWQDLLINQQTELVQRIFKEHIDLRENELAAKLFKSDKKVFDFQVDSGRIAASFMQQYHIDLTNAQERTKISWAYFNALLSGLGDDTPFRKATKIRAMEIPDDATADEQAYIKKMKQLYSLDVADAPGEESLAEQMAGMDRIQRVKFLAARMKREKGDQNG